MWLCTCSRCHEHCRDQPQLSPSVVCILIIIPCVKLSMSSTRNIKRGITLQNMSRMSSTQVFCEYITFSYIWVWIRPYRPAVSWDMSACACNHTITEAELLYHDLQFTLLWVFLYFLLEPCTYTRHVWAMNKGSGGVIWDALPTLGLGFIKTRRANIILVWFL